MIKLPSGWRIERLGNCCQIISGSTPSRSKPEYWGGNISWVTPKDLSNLKSPILEDTPEKITEAGYKSCSTTLMPTGTILFSSRAPIGYVAIAGKPMCSNQGFKNLVPSSSVYSAYLYWCMRYFARNLAALGSGTTFKEVSKGIIEKFQIPLPPLEDQRRIAAILDKADTVRRKRQEAIALTEELLRSAFLEMFGEPVTNPKGWEVKPLGSLCTIRRGGSPRPIEAYLGGSIPWIKIGDATEDDDIYIYKTAEAIKPEGVKKSLYLEPGSLIFANCGVSLGFARILEIGGCIHDGWLSFSEINESLNKIYLLKLLNSVTKHFRQIAPSGTQPNLNISIMTSFGIPVPPIQCQLEFVNIVTTISSGKQRQSEAVKEADDLFNSLLQRAFRGEL